MSTFKLGHCYLIVLWLLAFTDFGIAEQNGFESHKFGFSLSYVGEFETVPTEIAGVEILLRRVNSQFPTFNIIVEACDSRVFEQSKTEQSLRLRSDYRRVGLSDAEIRSSQTFKFRNFPAFRGVLEYSNQGKKFVSSVLRILHNDLCYILTYIDLTERYDQQSFFQTQLEDGFLFAESEIEQSPISLSAISNYLPLAILLGFAFLLALYLRRRRLSIPKR